MSGPLTGLRVVEFSGIGPGPLAGQLLADLGADVICIDRVAGAADPTDINRRNKRSIVLDLKLPGGIATAKALLDVSDVLIEGFRPGVMERLGLGPADVSARLIYGRMTGWGQDGPLALRAGHDINYLALTGALHAIGHRQGPPVPPLNLIADFGGGALFLVFGILAALHERQRSGLGQVVDAAMIDGVPAMMGLIHGFNARGEWSVERESNLLDGGAPFYRCYECSDGKAVAVGPLEPQFFAQLVDRAGLDPAWKQRQYHRADWPELAAELTSLFRQRSRDEWTAIFDGSDACVSPVLTMVESADHPHNRARRNHVADRDFVEAAPAPRFSRTPAPVPRAPTASGADGAAILSELGITNAGPSR